jgi:hypothetical protein
LHCRYDRKSVPRTDLPAGDRGGLARDLIARLPEDDPVLEADRRQAGRVLAERARVASESFQRKDADWDEMRALDLPAQAVADTLSGRPPAADGDSVEQFLAERHDAARRAAGTRGPPQPRKQVYLQCGTERPRCDR